ncbi:MAG: hypothetical protein CMN29_04205 [Sandaracinus sp.]|nr:hypothetical protein [Sandaracinus sp.]
MAAAPLRTWLRAIFALSLGALLLMTAPACDGDDDGGEAPPETEPAEAPPLPTPDLRIVAITDLKGYLEPCGCTSRPLGGIDRLAARLGELRAEAPTLFVAAGDLLFTNEQHAGPAAEAQERMRAETLVGILDQLELVATSLGDLDFQQGVAGFEALRAEAGFAVLASGVRLPAAADAGAEPNEEPNEREAADEEATSALRPLEGLRRVEAGGAPIGLLGVSALREPPEGVEVPAAPLDAAREALAEEPPALVLALVTGDRRLGRAVAELEGVDFVVQAGLDRAEALPPAEAGGSWIVHGGRQGQGLLVLDLYRPGAEGAWTNVSRWSVDVEREQLDEEIASLEARIDEWRREGRAEADLARQEARLARMRADRNALQAPALPDGGPAFAARWVPLDPDSPRDEGVRERLARYDRQGNEHNREALADRAPPPVEEGQPRYVGSGACASCHQAAHTWWEGHPHGNAYATLVERNKQFHLNCVGCHVTGYERPGGSTVTQNLDGALVNVGCEVCHGPGSAHVANPVAASIARDAPERLCVDCHNEEHSDLFDYDAYRASLLVPGHGRPE